MSRLAADLVARVFGIDLLDEERTKMAVTEDILERLQRDGSPAARRQAAALLAQRRAEGYAAGPGAAARARAWWAGLRPETRAASAAASVAALGGIALGVLLGRGGGCPPPAPAAPAGGPAPLPSGAATAHPGAAGGTLVVDTRGKLPAALRPTAGKAEKAIATIPNGTIVAVIGEGESGGDHWYQVRLPSGQVGWIHGGVLK